MLASAEQNTKAVEALQLTLMAFLTKAAPGFSSVTTNQVVRAFEDVNVGINPYDFTCVEVMDPKNPSAVEMNIANYLQDSIVNPSVEAMNPSVEAVKPSREEMNIAYYLHNSDVNPNVEVVDLDVNPNVEVVEALQPCMEDKDNTKEKIDADLVVIDDSNKQVPENSKNKGSISTRLQKGKN